MALQTTAIVENGRLRLLDDVPLQEGQTVRVTILDIAQKEGLSVDNPNTHP